MKKLLAWALLLSALGGCAFVPPQPPMPPDSPQFPVNETPPPIAGVQS